MRFRDAGQVERAAEDLDVAGVGGRAERAADPDRPAMWCRHGLMLKTVADPAASLAAYRHAEQLLAPDVPRELRARVLHGLAWKVGAGSGPLLAEAATLLPEPDDETLAQIEATRLITTIRLGRFAECEAVALNASTIIDRVRRPDLAYVVTTMAASALACAGNLDAALRRGERGGHHRPSGVTLLARR